MSLHRLLGLGLGLVFMGRSAPAADYQILRGTLSGPDGGREALTGHFESEPIITLEYVPGERTLLVDDFALQAGDRSFTRAGPPSFEGIDSVVQIGDVIRLLGNDVDSAWLRSGGDVIRSNPIRVTLRYLDFRSRPDDGGSAVGVLPERRLPRRLHLAGDLVEVEQSFEIQSLCVRLDDPLIGLEPVPGGSGDVSLVAVGGVGEAPRLDEPGGSISIRGDLDDPRLIPADIGFRIEIVRGPDPIPLPFCAALWPILPPVEQVAGRFDLIATGARPVPIDVRPAQTNNVVLPGSPGHVSVAILAARALDPCPIDERSLRLGDGEAEPIPWSGRELTRRQDVDGDGAPDLVARFRVRDTGIAFGDDSICLVAQTRCGEFLEGCDAIQTLPHLP
jgi:hypothetical protein